MGRRRPLVLTLAGSLLLLGLGGCSRLPGSFYPDRVDLARAQRVWQDPWAAPHPQAPEAGFGTTGVFRDTGGRESVYAHHSPTSAARLEVRTAVRHGWDLVAVSCRPAAVHAVLTRDPDDLDRTAAAALVVTRAGRRSAKAAVRTAVPHHLDGAWPDLGSAVAPEDTCLVDLDAPSGDLPRIPWSGPPLDEREQDVDVPQWPGDEVPARARSLEAAVSRDPWFAATGLTFHSPAVLEVRGRRSAPRAGGTLRADGVSARGALAAVVSRMDGWELTWVSCGPGASTAATLRLRTGEGPAVARLEADPRHAGRVQVTVRLPVYDGPDASWIDGPPSLHVPRCLARAPLPGRGLLVEGVPVGLPDDLEPVSQE